MIRNKNEIKSKDREKMPRINGRIPHLHIITRFIAAFGAVSLLVTTALFIIAVNEGRCLGIGKLKRGDKRNVATQPEEYQLKMSFIEKLTRFVHWPDSSSVKDTSKPFIIGFIGQLRHKSKAIDVFTTNVKEIKGKPVKVLVISEKEDILKCDMLVIFSSEKNKLSSIIETVKNKPILTVSDADGFAQKGVHINYMISRKGSCEFVLNEGALLDSRLDVRHQLKQFAKKIVNKQSRRRRR